MVNEDKQRRQKVMIIFKVEKQNFTGFIDGLKYFRGELKFDKKKVAY